jgi:hypothetical protein
MFGCRTRTDVSIESFNLNLSKLGPFPKDVTLHLVRTYLELPQKVRERIGSNVSNPGGPFNAGDTSIPLIPDRRMIFAYQSDGYCLIHFERGGITHEFVVVLFELSKDQAVARWAHAGEKFEGIDVFRARLQHGSLTNEVDEIVW